MITYAKTKDSNLARVAGNMSPDNITNIQQECMATIVTTEVFLGARQWLDKEAPGRPYLHLIGECVSLKGDLPFDVKGLFFDKGNGIPIDMFYEFTNKELAEMTLKGLYEQGFECPSILNDNEYDIPVTCDLTIVNPQGENDLPIIFADIVNRRSVQISEASTGYTLGDYFEMNESEQEFVDDSVEWQHEDTIDITYTNVEKHQPESVLKSDEINFESPLISHFNNIEKRVLTDHLEKSNEEFNKDFVLNKELFEKDNTSDDNSNPTLDENIVTSDNEFVADSIEDEQKIESSQHMVEANQKANIEDDNIHDVDSSNSKRRVPTDFENIVDKDNEDSSTFDDEYI